LEEAGILLYMNRVHVLNSQELRNLVMKEMHNVSYTEHPRYHKTTAVVRGQYFWPGVKRDVASFIVRYMEC
jgi:hypothetical protein